MLNTRKNKALKPTIHTCCLFWTRLCTLMALLLILTGGFSSARAQIVTSTEGTDFWLSFAEGGFQAGSLKVFVTSKVSTSGTIESAEYGFSQTFTVGANQAITIDLPVGLTNSNPETIDSASVRVTTNDPVAVYAMNVQNATTDASRVLPTSALSDEYMIPSFAKGGFSLGSFILLLATEDSTDIEVYPTVTTMGSVVPPAVFTVMLNKGQTYLLKAQSGVDADLTGSLVKSLDPNKPIAVFGGNSCTNLPSNCGACDRLYDQAIPLGSWGNKYYVSPLDSATRYAYRVLASEPNTQVLIDGVARTLNAGDTADFFGQSGAHCVEGDKPISVIQYLEGKNCTGVGDPAMMVLNSEDEKLSKATFLTVNTTLINLHYLNVVIETADIGLLTLDGVLVAPSEFIAFPSCPSYSYAQIQLAGAGSYTLDGNGSAFTAYIYGFGDFESYAYSVGSTLIVDVPSIDVDACSNESITLVADPLISNVVWTNFVTNDTLGTGQSLTLSPPLQTRVIKARGDQTGSTADTTVYYNLNVIETPFGIAPYTAADTLCTAQPVQLEARVLDLLLAASCDEVPVQPNWQAVSTLSIADTCGNPTNFALYFDNNGNRFLESNDVDVSNGGIIRFDLLIGGGVNSCTDADPGEDVVLEYSLNGGGLWNIIDTYLESEYPDFISIEVDLSIDAWSPSTRFRWRQLSNSGAGDDIWALDEIQIFRFASQTSTYAFNWSPGITAVDSTVANPLVATDTLLQMQLEVTDTSGCRVVESLIKILTPLLYPVIDLGPDTVMCEGDSLEFSVNEAGLLSYLWQDSSTAPGIQVLQPGSYAVTVSNFCGTGADSMVVDSLIPALVKLGIDTFLCPGDSIRLDATVALGSYLWQDGSTNPLYTVSDSGVYWCVATNSCGTDVDTLDVLLLLPPTPDLISDTAVCFGDSIVISAFDTLGSYLWSDGSTMSTLTIDALGTYSVTATNTCGVGADTIDVDYYGPPDITLGPDSILCPGGVVGYVFNEPYSQYQWSDGTSNTSFNLGTGGTYWVQVMNACGADSDTVVFTSFPFPFADLGGDTTICEEDSLLLDATFPGATYLWSNATNDSTITINGAGTSWVAVTNVCGVYSDTIQVSLHDSILFDLGPDTVVCTGEEVVLKTGLDPTYNYFWNGGVTVDSLTVSMAGQYWLNVSNVCGNGTDTIDVLYEQVPTVELGSDQLRCAGDSLVLGATFSRSTYLWSTGATTDSIAAGVTGTYSVVVTNLCGTGEDSMFVDFADTLQVSLGPDLVGCEGTPETVQARWNMPTNMLWSTGSEIAEIQIYQPGNYWVRASNICGQVSDSIYVGFNPLPSVSVRGAAEVCKDEVTYLQANSNWPEIEWQDGSTADSLETNSPGVYWAAVSNNCGTVKDTFVLRHRNRPALNLGSDQIVCADDPVLLEVPGRFENWAWENGSSVRSRQLIDPGTYTLQASDDLGCEASDSIVLYTCPNLWVPNAFTPGRNGINDMFKPEGEAVNQYRFTIYNRWGEKLFETTDLQAGWNGIYKGVEAPAMTYVWRVEFINELEEEEVRTGSFTLLR